jgi:hypothetical protein
MTKKNEKIFEIDDRHCPICGAFITTGEPLHKCSEKELKKIDRQNEMSEIEEIPERTYTDKLAEFEEFYNAENIYNDEEE